MDSKTDAFQVGDSVRFKAGQKDEDSGIDIGGWQGRVVEVDAEHERLLVALDSVTLKSLPRKFLEESEEEGLDWAQYYIGQDDVEAAEPRDTEQDVEEAAAEISDSLGWVWLGDEGRAINAALGDALAKSDYEQMEAWEEHLREVLDFPFVAEVSEWQKRGSPLRPGDKVRVLAINGVYDLYGVLVDIKKGRHSYTFPLCDLEVVPEDSPNHDPVQLYAVWFANR